jgi:hypothetical protein
VTPREALQHVRTLVEASADLRDDIQRKVLLRSVVVVAQKGLGVAPDGVAECEPNVLAFPTHAAETILRRAGFFGTHAPRDKENQPEMPERKHAGDPMLFWRDPSRWRATP